MRARKEKKPKSPQRQQQPPPPQQDPQTLAAAASTNAPTPTTVGTDNKRIFPSRHLDVPALYETKVRN